MLKLLPIIAWALLLAFLSDKRSRYVLDQAGRKQYTRKDLAIYLVMALSMAAFVGLRTRGNDTYAYRHLYENLTPVGLSNIGDIDWRKVSDAPGLQCLTILFKTWGFSVQDYLMVTALFTVCTYLWFIRKYTCSIWLSIFYFLTMGVYDFTMAAIKQTMAVAFLLLATDGAIQKKWGRYVIWLLVAELFHPYSFVYLVVPFVAFRPWSRGTRYLLAGALALALFMSQFLSAIDIVTTSLGYSYDEGEFTGEGVNIFRVMVVWVPLVLSFLGRRAIGAIESRATNIILNLMMVNSVIMFIGLFGTANYFARLANYFLIFQVVGLPYVLTLFSRDNERILKRLSAAGFAAYYYYGAAIANGGFDANYNFMSLLEYLKRK